MPKRLTTEIFLERANKVHDGKYSYPDPYKGSLEHMTIVCPLHGNFSQQPASHLFGSGCPVCGIEKVSAGARSTMNTFADRANVIHNNKYSYIGEYINARTKISIICPVHGIFEQTPDHHLGGRGCPGCANIKKANGNRSSFDEFVNKSMIIHGGIYEYPEQEYVDARSFMKIVCKFHGIFEQLATIHLMGSGCQKCYIESKTKNTEKFIEEANIVHNNKYSYPDFYVDCVTYINIICPIHGSFSQRPKNHLEGHGCVKCFNDRFTKTTEQFIEEANKVHNNYYGYPEPYINCRTKINIECPKHGIFSQSPGQHLSGNGCQYCSDGITISKVETAWLDFLNIPIENRQGKIKIGKKRLKPDAYDPITNTIYEFYGDYYHGNPNIFDPNKMNLTVKKTFGDLYSATLAREALILSAGYNLVSIWESDWKLAKKSQ